MDEDYENGSGVDFDSLVSSGTPGLASGSSPSTSYLSSSVAAHPQTAGLLAELERKTRARKLAVPTNDTEVRARLREIGEPMTLFGEQAADRRERLRYVLSQIAALKGSFEKYEEPDPEETDESDEEEEKEEEFYTQGSDELLHARQWIAQYSLARAKTRVARQREEAVLPLGRLLDVRKAVFAQLKSFTNLGSQIGSSRPVSNVRFSPDSSLLLTGSWSGTAKVWDVPSLNMRGGQNGIVYKGHKNERIGGLAWHPGATLSQSPESLNFATGGADNNVCLWGLDNSKPLLNLEGHSGRVCRVAFHPSGRFIASASYDGTWRLWDAEKGGEELLLQEGHSKEVYSIEFQGDGSLLCSGGLDAIGRVWDLRSGRTAMVLDGHVKDILAIDFSPNGHQIATGSNDDTIRIWDMRALKSIYTIAAHRSTVSDVRFFRYDSSSTRHPPAYADLSVFKNRGSAGARNKEKMVTMAAEAMNGIERGNEEEALGALQNGGGDSILNGNENEHADGLQPDEDEKPVLMEEDENGVDVPLSGLYLASSGYDGVVKIWSADDWQLIKGMSSDAGGKVMSVDLSSDGRFLATGEWGRTFKLWSSENF